jgi:hypothetical protein
MGQTTHWIPAKRLSKIPAMNYHGVHKPAKFTFREPQEKMNVADDPLLAKAN